MRCAMRPAAVFWDGGRRRARTSAHPHACCCSCPSAAPTDRPTGEAHCRSRFQAAESNCTARVQRVLLCSALVCSAWRVRASGHLGVGSPVAVGLLALTKFEPAPPWRKRLSAGARATAASGTSWGILGIFGIFGIFGISFLPPRLGLASGGCENCARRQSSATSHVEVQSFLATSHARSPETMLVSPL